MTGLLLLLILIAIFGVGTVLEAAFWTLVLVAVAVLIVGLLAAYALKRLRAAAR